MRWRSTGDRTATATIDLGRDAQVSIISLMEEIERGQAVSRYSVDGRGAGDWQRLASGTTIGYRKLDRVATPATIRELRLTVEDAIRKPDRVTIGVY